MTVENCEDSTVTLNEQSIKQWLVRYIADVLKLPESEIDVTRSFDSYGIDSAAAVGMTGDLEDWCACEVDPTLAYDYPTIGSLAAYIAQDIA